MLIFALDATREFGAAVAGALGVELASHEERAFEDGEHKARPLTSVRGRDAYVVQSLHGGPDTSPNDKLCRLLFLRPAGRRRAARDQRSSPAWPKQIAAHRCVASLIHINSTRAKRC